jgi:hypothetical protein
MTQKGNDIIALVTGGVMEQTDITATTPVTGTTPAFDFNAAMGIADDCLAAALFDETVVYVPEMGEERTIKVYVSRRKAELIGVESGSARQGRGPLLRVMVRNDATTGIASSELKRGLDKIRLAVLPGRTAEERMIADIADIDNSMMTLEVR